MTGKSIDEIRTDFEAFAQEAAIWQDATFPTATVDSVLAHMREEVEEIAHAKSWEVAQEAADIGLLLLAFAQKQGFSLFDSLDLIDHGRRRAAPGTEYDGIHAAFDVLNVERTPKAAGRLFCDLIVCCVDRLSSLQAEMQRKIEINKTRKWTVLAPGGYTKAEKPAATADV